MSTSKYVSATAPTTKTESPGSKIVKTLTVDIREDKTILPEIDLSGQWTMREILALQGLIVKAYRKHMSVERASLASQTNNEE